MIEQPPEPGTYQARPGKGKCSRGAENPLRVTKTELAIGRLLYPEQVERPRVRADCDSAPRPCPFVGCRHHIGVDVDKNGTLLHTRPDVEPWDLLWSCSLDLAEHDGMTLEQVGHAIGVSRERVRQIEMRALEKAVRNAKRLGIDLAALAPLQPEGFPEP